MDSISVNSSIQAFPRGLTTKRPQNYGFSSRNLPSSSRRHRAVSDISAASVDPAQAEVTWQIVVGALAGATPFVVAGIEFSKRIIEQKNCKVCGGSGLVLRDNKYYFRCPACGGFLPWQSWRRFFTG